MPKPIYNKEGEKAKAINLRFVKSCGNCKFSITNDDLMGQENYINCTKYPEINFKYELDFNTICDDYKE